MKIEPPMTAAAVARAARIHRKLAKLYEELGSLLEAPDPAPPVVPTDPPSEMDQARARKVLLKKGYKATG